MTREELRQWLTSLRTGEESNDIINWILDALRQTSYTFDVEEYEKMLPRKDRHLNDVLTGVAYSLPHLPRSFRRKKPFLFNVDMEQFFDMSDKEWEEYRKKFFAGYENILVRPVEH